jgi:hypothetical protein
VHYEKTYLDLVSERGVVCVAYDSRLELFGFTSHAAGVEIYGTDGSRRVLRASARAVRDEHGSETRLSFALQRGAFRMVQRALHGPLVPEGPAPNPQLSWRLRTARAETEAELELDGVTERFHGFGYEDTVTIGAPTRRLGLAVVEWGRAHVGDETWVFNVVESVTGERWARGFRFGAETASQTDAVAIVRSDRGLRVRFDDTAQPLALTTGRVLHAGEALDAARFPSRLERTLTRALSGRIMERRTLANATLGTDTGWAIEERIELGPRARTRSVA